MYGRAYGQNLKETEIFSYKDLGSIGEVSLYCYFDGGICYFKVILSTISYDKDKHTLKISGKVCDRKNYETFCEIYAYKGCFDTISCKLTAKYQFAIDCTGYFNAILDISNDENLYFNCSGYSLIECSIDKQKLKKYP